MKKLMILPLFLMIFFISWNNSKQPQFVPGINMKIVNGHLSFSSVEGYNKFLETFTNQVNWNLEKNDFFKSYRNKGNSFNCNVPDSIIENNEAYTDR